jgi:hypothetical protein
MQSAPLGIRIGRRISLDAAGGSRCGEQKVVKQPCMLQWWQQSKRLLRCSGDGSASRSARREIDFIEMRGLHRYSDVYYGQCEKECPLVCAIQSAGVKVDHRDVQREA